MSKYLSKTDIVIILATILLFITALFTKGITHDLFLEGGILLVSIKIIIMHYKNTITSKAILKELEDIKNKLHDCTDK